jgi:hypothetical protein
MGHHGCWSHRGVATHTSLLTSRSCVATLGVVEVRRGPGMGAHALARDLACSQGSGEAEPVPRGSGEAEPSPERSGEVGPSPEWSGEAEPASEGWGKLETFLVGLDQATTMLIIILDELRLISFNSYFMDTLILVPDSSPRTFGKVGYFAKGFFVRGALEVLIWLGGHGRLVVHV